MIEEFVFRQTVELLDVGTCELVHWWTGGFVKGGIGVLVEWRIDEFGELMNWCIGELVEWWIDE